MSNDMITMKVLKSGQILSIFDRRANREVVAASSNLADSAHPHARAHTRMPSQAQPHAHSSGSLLDGNGANLANRFLLFDDVPFYWDAWDVMVRNWMDGWE